MKKKSMLRRFAAGLLAGVLLACAAVPAMADSTEVIDLSKTGSISLQMKDKDGKAVSGGEIDLIPVADITAATDGTLSYTYTNGFENCGVELGDLSGSSLAKDLKNAMGSSVTKTTARIGSDGRVVFDNLELGIYLLVQTSAAGDYKKISPFVVSVPLIENGEYIYNVNAEPKMERVSKDDDDDDDSPSPTPTPAVPDQPGQPGQPPRHGKKLPQTGQLNWPIPMLAVSGVLLFAFGWYIRQKPREAQS